MEVKPRYKQTEVGVIPQDWRVEAIGTIGVVGRGRVISQREIARSHNPMYPVYSSQTSNNGVMGYLEVFDFEGEYITWTTDGANAGTVFYRDGRFNCTNVCGTIKLHSDDHDFVARVLSRAAPRHVSRHLGNPKLMNDVMKRVTVPLPPSIDEQRAIADALSGVDGLLSGLDQLVAKKRDLKQAAMQQLLTGQSRLPGFHGEWVVKTLGSVTDTDPENLGSDTHPGYSFNYISLEDVDQGELKSYSEQEFRTAPSRARRKLRKNDVLVATVRPSLKSHLLFQENGQRWVCSTGFCVLRCREDVSHPSYVFFQLFGYPVARQIDALLTGSNYPAINSGDVRSLEIPFPEYAEQIAIAEVLTDMDAELAALEQRREKTRALQQGMMQELLTGKTRLVSRKESHA